jgi:hypothetical protein
MNPNTMDGMSGDQGAQPGEEQGKGGNPKIGRAHV